MEVYDELERVKAENKRLVNAMTLISIALDDMPDVPMAKRFIEQVLKGESDGK